MAWSFGDSFDLYAATADAVAGYWDSGALTGVSLVAGRFAGSQALQLVNAVTSLTKASGVNDAVHHIVCAFRQTAALSGTTLGIYLELFDGTTAQCSIVFRSDGAIVLTSGGPAGTALATYTGAVSAQNTWFAFEFEVTINNTTGVFNVRKNGNTSNDFTATSLNTRGGTANNYANKLTVGMQAAVSAQQMDDLFWQSGAATGTWLGDIRCYARMPASDQSVQFSRNPMATVGAQTSTATITAGTARYTAPITAPCDASIGTLVANLNAGFTGNMKCAIFASNAGLPGAVLATATPIANPATGANTFTFPSPPTLTKGAQFLVGFDADTTSGTWWYSVTTVGFTSVTAYAAFPGANPTTTGSQVVPSCTVNYTPTSNNSLVNETLEDGATSYVYDSNPGDADFYGLAALGVTPASVIAVTTRGFMQKSDAGARTAAVQLKSGATTAASTAAALSTTWGWMWRTDVVDPNTGLAWTPTAVNNLQIGPQVVS